ncbi:MAG: hypothetical protein AB7H97_08240, partial [Pseudobdellovibrionaceae bacterium]
SFTGCGSRKTTSGSSEDSSRIPDASTTTKPVVQCNHISGSFIDAEVRTYVDVFGKAFVDKVRVTFRTTTNITAESLKTAKSAIVFYRWMASYPANIILDQNPLELWLEPRAGGAAVTGILKKIDWTEIDDILTLKGVKLSTIQDVFSQYSFVINLRDTDGTYDALATSLYQNGNLSSKVDTLIPVFHANPNDYAKDPKTGETRPDVLQSLHPFNSYRNSTIPNGDYTGMAGALCTTP